MFKSFDDYATRKLQAIELYKEKCKAQMARSSEMRDQFYTRWRAASHAQQTRHNAEKEQFEKEHPHPGCFEPEASYRRALLEVEMQYRHALEEADLERTWSLQLAEEQLPGDRVFQALQSEKDAILERMDQEWEQQQAEAEARRKQQSSQQKQSCSSSPSGQSGKRELTEAERKAYRDFQMYFHPDRHHRSPHYTRLAELAKLANMAYADRPTDLLDRLNRLRRQAEQLTT